jgi:mono/diheme cytochrome c family protein
MKNTVRTFALVACVTGAFTFSAKADDVKLPAGDGKALVEKTCSACHGVDTAVSETHTAAEWKGVVDTMVARGAEGTDAELATIVKYLAANFGPKK